MDKNYDKLLAIVQIHTKETDKEIFLLSLFRFIFKNSK